MADSPNPRNNGEHTDDDIVAAAFASYRAETPAHFTAPLPATALMTRAAAGRPRKRTLTISLAALACTAVMAAGVAVGQTVVSDSPDQIGADGDDGAGTSGDGDGKNGTTGADETPPSSDDSSEPVEDDLHTLVISLPDWPGDLAADCPAGDYTFDADAEGGDVPTGDAEQPQDLGAWELLPDGAGPLSTQLDGAGDDEVIVPVACGDAAGVVALVRTPDAFESLGFVHASRKPSGPITVAAVDGETVTLDFAGVQEQSTQQRIYAFNDGEFTEVEPGDDPSTDPSSPSDEPQTLPSEDDDDPTTEDPDSGDDPTSDKPGDSGSPARWPAQS